MDIGLNLLTWAMVKGMSLNEGDYLITSYIRGSDPYQKLKRDDRQHSYPRNDVIEKIARDFGISLEEALCEQGVIVDWLHNIANLCPDDRFHMSATTFMDNEGSCIMRLSVAVDAVGSTQLRLDYTYVDMFSDKSYTREASAHFLANGQWLDFDMDPDLVNHKYLWENIEVHPEFDDFAQGLMVFENGPVALAEHLRSLRTNDGEPWSKEGGSNAAGIELYTNEPLPSAYSANYRASIGSEEYDVLFTIDEEKIWEIRSTWKGKFIFDVYWTDVDDVWLQLIVQNAYETYDISRRIIDDVVGKYELPEQGEPRAQTRENSPFDGIGVTPDYDITRHRSYARPVEPVHINDLVVRSAIRTCGDPSHSVREVIAIVCVFTPGVGIVEVAVDAFCCPQCKRYYILEDDFAKLRSRGKICCRVVTKTGKINDFMPRGSADLSEQSFFNSLGYNVGKQDDLSSTERRTILDFAISNNLKTQKATIGFLQWLIDFNGKRANMEEAVEKWKSDIDYLMSDHEAEVERVKIDRIFLADKQWQ